MDLCWKGKTVERRRGRPSVTTPSSSPVPVIPKRKYLEYRPIGMIRTDNVGHWPCHTNQRERCNRPSFEEKSRIMFEKYQVHLCLSKGNPFLRTFHLRRA
nr:unnamed protein product [Callosobruchus chinensis]